MLCWIHQIKAQTAGTQPVHVGVGVRASSFLTTFSLLASLVGDSFSCCFIHNDWLGCCSSIERLNILRKLWQCGAVSVSWVPKWIKNQKRKKILSSCYPCKLSKMKQFATRCLVGGQMLSKNSFFYLLTFLTIRKNNYFLGPHIFLVASPG